MRPGAVDLVISKVKSIIHVKDQLMHIETESFRCVSPPHEMSTGTERKEPPPPPNGQMNDIGTDRMALWYTGLDLSQVKAVHTLPGSRMHRIAGSD